MAAQIFREPRIFRNLHTKKVSANSHRYLPYFRQSKLLYAVYTHPTKIWPASKRSTTYTYPEKPRKTAETLTERGTKVFCNFSRSLTNQWIFRTCRKPQTCLAFGYYPPTSKIKYYYHTSMGKPQSGCTTPPKGKPAGPYYLAPLVTAGIQLCPGTRCLVARFIHGGC